MRIIPVPTKRSADPNYKLKLEIAYVYRIHTFLHTSLVDNKIGVPLRFRSFNPSANSKGHANTLSRRYKNIFMYYVNVIGIVKGEIK